MKIKDSIAYLIRIASDTGKISAESLFTVCDANAIGEYRADETGAITYEFKDESALHIYPNGILAVSCPA